LNPLRNNFANTTPTYGPEVIQSNVKISDALKKFAQGHNVDIEDLFKTDDEVKPEQTAGTATPNG